MRNLAQGLVILAAVILLAVVAAAAGKLASDPYLPVDTPGQASVASVPPVPTSLARPTSAPTVVVSLPGFPVAPAATPPGPNIPSLGDVPQSMPAVTLPAQPGAEVSAPSGRAENDPAVTSPQAPPAAPPAPAIGVAMAVLGSPTAGVAGLPSATGTPIAVQPAPTRGTDPAATPTTAVSIAAPTATVAVFPTIPTNMVIPTNTPLPTATAFPANTPQPTATTAPPGGGVIITLSPATSQVPSGQTVSVDIQVVAGSQKVDAVQASLRFDASKLQVDSITSSTALPTVLLNPTENERGRADLAQGRLNYAAGASLEPGKEPSGSFTVATVRFKALQPGTAAITFTSSPPPKTEAAMAGKPVPLSPATAAIVIVQ